MNKNHPPPILIALSILLFTTWCATSVFGQLSLTNIPLATDPFSQVTDTSNEGRAITHDGKYVGGLSGTGHGFLYSVTDDYLSIPVAGSYASIITGIGYRTDTNQVPAQLQVVLDGNNAGYHGQYMTWDGGTNWGFKRRDNVSPIYTLSAYPSPRVNSLAATTDSDVYLNIFKSSSEATLYLCRGSNLWDAATAAQVTFFNKSTSGGDTLDVLGVAANGRVVGLRKTGGIANNTLWDYPASSGTQWQWNGLDGTIAGQAWSVSLDGTCIFGWSHTLTDAVGNYGYKTVISGFKSGTNSPTQMSIDPLPEFADTGGSTTRTVPHSCTVDGKYAVGYNYRGVTTAVLWDTSAPDPANWTITDLYALAAANGAADIFAGLVKGYSVGTNTMGDPVITGYGYDDSFNTRAFVMTVPKWIAAIQFPISQTATGGANVTLSLKTNATDSLAYQWYKDGSLLSGETTTALALTSVSCAGGEAGDYSIVVSNTAISRCSIRTSQLSHRPPCKPMPRAAP